MAKKFFVATFGCRTNQADSAAIRQAFLDQSFLEADDHRQADVIVVNSCTVTHRSDQQVRQLARKMRRENPSAKIVLTGCYAQRSPEAAARIEGLDFVVGNTFKGQIVEIANSPVPAGVSELAEVYRDDFRKVRAIDLTPATQIGGKTRPFVKIQDGCDACCSYCIIPQVRGPSRSVPPDLIYRQVEELIEHGFQEIVLTGIHIGTYGMHFQPRVPLDRLLARLIKIPGLGQLRLSSIEPMELSRRVIRLAAESERIAPHFHICLQSGSDSVLRRMLRPYDTARFASIVEEIRETIPDAGIGTDVIVGFPGETDREFQETVEFVRRMPFTYLHVFPYSDRAGTAASRMRDKLNPSVIKQRSQILRELSEAKNREFRTSFVGRSLRLLTLTEEQNGYREAVTGNYLKARIDTSIPGNKILTGKVLTEEQGYLKLAAS
ncbi:MAG TPA: tRNA (N(6)-L-threonylcarbamoyladenosine(37)-C(2))-methylthiotransferase MtaB [Acidobacteriota bacterium]|nr:tRNA (N(6)-L-threonylcarbamoyladenosine(37)-C(2))-methylthiotransferase MtaB [Acidobacteriota bacterium]